MGQRLPRARVVIGEGEVAGVTALETFGAGHEPEFKAREMDRDAPAAILYTSGTTGRQKGAVLSHGNVVSNLFTVNRYLRMAPADRMLITTPLFHVAAQNVGMNAGLNAAATLVLHRRVDVERCAAAIEEHKVTFMSGVPTIYIALMNAGVSLQSPPRLRLRRSAPQERDRQGAQASAQGAGSRRAEWLRCARLESSARIVVDHPCE